MGEATLRISGSREAVATVIVAMISGTFFKVLLRTAVPAASGPPHGSVGSSSERLERPPVRAPRSASSVWLEQRMARTAHGSRATPVGSVASSNAMSNFIDI